MNKLFFLKQSSFKKLWHALMVSVITLVFLLFSGNVYTQTKPSYLELPDGTQFDNWEVPVTYTKTYYVDNGNRNASDSNPGTQDQPFLTISKAAEVLQPGERVVINSGIYREAVRPAQGGSGPDKLISYEAAPGANVIVKGSVVADKGKWEESHSYRPRTTPDNPVTTYQYDLEGIDFRGYNPFGMVNLMHDDRQFLRFEYPDNIKRSFLRRGMIYVDGRRLTQVEFISGLVTTEDAFWVEQDGLTVHLRLKGGSHPSNHNIELVIRERVFTPKLRGVGYIRVKGITFEHAANEFPWPQRGAVSLNRGHHWIIEDCVVRHANAVGIDIGGEGTGGAVRPGPTGSAIIRRTHIYDIGVSGICGLGGGNSLIESCTLEDIGWQNVERNWESGAIKFHNARNTVVANCVFRNIYYAPGVWFDVSATNSRITNNVFINIIQTLKAAIYIEVSPRAGNMVDHNIIWNVVNMVGETLSNWNVNTFQAGNQENRGRGIQVDGSDEGIYAHNFIGMCGAGIQIFNIEDRIGGTGGGISRWNNLKDNIFYRNTVSINLPSEATFVDGNLYARTVTAAGGGGGGSGGASAPRNQIVRPENIQPDIFAWQKYFGYDKNGGFINNLNVRINADDLTLTWSSEGDTPNVTTGTHFRFDFLGNTASKIRKAGPFATFPENNKTISIDPRKK